MRAMLSISDCCCAKGYYRHAQALCVAASISMGDRDAEHDEGQLQLVESHARKLVELDPSSMDVAHSFIRQAETIRTVFAKLKEEAAAMREEASALPEKNRIVEKQHQLSEKPSTTLSSSRRESSSPWCPDKHAVPVFSRDQKKLSDKEANETNPPPCRVRPELTCVDDTRKAKHQSVKKKKKKDHQDSQYLATLYPCAPLWLRDPSGFCSRFIPSGEGQLVAMMITGSVNQRTTDLQWQALIELTGGQTCRLPMREISKLCKCVGYKVFSPTKSSQGEDNLSSIAELMAQGRLQQDQSFTGRLSAASRCDRCHCIIDLPDPPECICGTNYCSAACFNQDSSAHKQQCRTIVENSELACMLTELYWKAVFAGEAAYPYASTADTSNLNDHVASLAVARQAALSPAPFRDFPREWHDHITLNRSRDTLNNEITFYEDYERPYLRDRLVAAQTACFRLLEAAGPCASRDDIERPVMSELWAQMEYILTPNNTTTSTSTEGSKDSISRLMFKLMIVQAFETVCKQMEDQLIAGGDTDLTRIKAIHARIKKGKDELAAAVNMLDAKSLERRHLMETFRPGGYRGGTVDVGAMFY